MKTIQKQKRVSTAMQVAKLAKISHNTDNSIIICLENFTVIRGKEILNSADNFFKVMQYIMKIHNIEDAIFDIKIDNVVFEGPIGAWILKRFRSIEITNSHFYDLVIRMENVLEYFSFKDSSVGCLVEKSGGFCLSSAYQSDFFLNLNSFEFQSLNLEERNKMKYNEKATCGYCFHKKTVLNFDNVSLPRFRLYLNERENVIFQNFNLSSESWSYEISGIENVSQINFINEKGKEYFDAIRNAEIEKFQKKLF